MTSHAIYTLRGNYTKKGISVSNGQVPFTPYSGMTRDNSELLAATPADGNLDKVYIAITEYGVVLVPCEEVPQRELVLVEEFANGVGSKRWPSFSVKFGPEVRKLSEAATGQGSGREIWTFVSAPLGWAENIARQFINERDYPGQTISYEPDYSGEQESDVPRRLIIAFGGNEGAARQFMAKVENLPLEVLDEHIISGCGRARVRAHLVEVSDDTDFFMGADPNSVVWYVSEVHFERSEPKNDIKGDIGGGNTAIAEALRKAGLRV